MKVNENRRYTIALLSLGTLLFLSKLWEGDLRGDSIFYAEVAKELLRTGDWITLHHGLHPYFNKPPLLFWLTAITYKIFGISDFGARLWSPLLAFFAGLMFYKLCLNWFDQKVAFLSALILFLTKDYVKDNMGLRLDSAVILSIIAYLYFTFNAKNKYHMLLAALSLGFGLLSKGIQAFYGPIIAFCYGIISKDERFKLYPFIFSCILGLALFLGWAIAVYLRNGDQFVNTFFFEQILGRATGSFSSYSKGKIHYLEVLLENYWPWILLFPFGLYSLIKEATRRQKILVICWLVIISLSLYFPEPEYGRYLLPLYPAMAIPQGYFIAKFMDHKKIEKLATLIIYLSFVLFIFINIFPIQIHKIRYERLRELKPLIEYYEKRGENVFVLWPKLRTYSAVLFYLDLPPHKVIFSKDAAFEGLLITEVANRVKLPADCTEIFSNEEFVLLKCPQ